MYTNRQKNNSLFFPSKDLFNIAFRNCPVYQTDNFSLFNPYFFTFALHKKMYEEYSN